MADHQNLFTTVQVVGPTPAGRNRWAGATARARVAGPRCGTGRRLGNAQLGPIYLGPLGVASLIFGTLSINIMGLNMLASVNWDPIQFIRQLFWLSLIRRRRPMV